MLITPFDPIYQKAARKLILTGLGEHWGWIDEHVNIDLENIAISYSDGDFVLGWIGDILVATGALIPENKHSSRVVRMSVAKDFRRQGFGVQILDYLFKLAKQKSKKKIVLETTETWDKVIEFYKSNGFQIDEYRDGDVHMSCYLD